ncbi:MAG: PQQ-binding-like beta-propeller repeat protein [Actinobacteria bacterium]|nr:PQQ-binding-like beta-propeller repeat protein [Actinomycetota bacterium]
MRPRTARPRRPAILTAQLLAAGALAVLAAGTLMTASRLGEPVPAPLPAPEPLPEPPAPPTSAPVAAAPTPSPTPTLHPLVDRSSVGAPWGTVAGVLQFRGNPTRTWYGLGPVPSSPQVRWRYPDEPMCTDEPIRSRAGTADPPVKRWCGTGWTGQPAVWERPDGVVEVVVGAYDGAVHFISATSGRALRPPFETGHIIKGSVTLDPDGFPLLYTGSRDGYLRVVALDRDGPTQLWALPANRSRIWNDDWDGNPTIVDGLLVTGGEDGWFYVIDLKRGYDAAGRVTVDPTVVVQLPGWDQKLLRAVGDRNVSFESSVAIFEGHAFVANSAGRVIGYDLSQVRDGHAPVVFEYWTGDDTDATIVIDRDGMLYVASELERRTARGRQVGQLVKLDRDRPGDPRVWGLDVPARPGAPANEPGGIWGTPALHEGVLYVTTHAGDLLAVDSADGQVVWREPIGYHEWSSPVVVDDTLIVGACQRAGMLAFDVRDPRRPRPRWSVQLGGCVESTPAVWRGGIYVGSRDGFVYAVGDR